MYTNNKYIYEIFIDNFQTHFPQKCSNKRNVVVDYLTFSSIFTYL